MYASLDARCCEVTTQALALATLEDVEMVDVLDVRSRRGKRPDSLGQHGAIQCGHSATASVGRGQMLELDILPAGQDCAHRLLDLLLMSAVARLRARQGNEGNARHNEAHKIAAADLE